MRKVFILATVLMFISFGLIAKTYDKNWGNDLKLPTQQMLEKITISTPAVASASYVLPIHAGDTTGALTTITTGFTNPDVPRTLIVYPGVSGAASVKAGFVTITGTNFFGVTISEGFSTADNDTTAIDGTKAFKTITSIQFPIEDSAYTAGWSIGITAELGLNKCLDDSGDIGWVTLDGTFEGTRPTITVDEDEVSKNTVDFNTAYDGAKDAVVYFIQNFRCP